MIPYRTALIAGATGLVGSHCLQQLLQNRRYNKVVVITRRELDIKHPKLEQKIIDFNKLISTPGLVADDIFCCLGTTMKQAGSKEAFYKVDYTYVTDLAKATSHLFASQFLVVSAMGADPDSLFYYNQVKGQMEEAVKKLSFTAVHIFRPSLLLGKRKESRLGEKIGAVVLKAIRFALAGPLKKYRAIEAGQVATAMIKMAMDGGGGIKIHESDEIAELAAEVPSTD